MRILHLLYESKGDPFGCGGAAIRMISIYRRLRFRHEVTLLCRKYPGAVDGLIEGLSHRFVGCESRDFARTLLEYALRARQFVYRYGRRYDVIVEEFSPAVPLFLNTYRTRPVVLQVQGFTGRHYFGKYPIHQALPLFLMERARPPLYRRQVHVSPVTLGGRGRHRIVIPNGVDPELLRLTPKESNYILYLGRLDIHHKGLDILLDAFGRIAGGHPRVRLLLAGDGRDRERCRDIARRLPGAVSRRIRFCGWLNAQRKTSVLQNALFVVLPSRYETQGIAVLEAAACGKAVIVSDIEALRYIVAVGGGASFACGDPEQLALRMNRLLNKEDERHNMGIEAREWVREYTWDKIAQQFEGFLNRIVDEDTSTHL